MASSSVCVVGGRRTVFGAVAGYGQQGRRGLQLFRIWSGEAQGPLPTEPGAGIVARQPPSTSCRSAWMASTPLAAVAWKSSSGSRSEVRPPSSFSATGRGPQKMKDRVRGRKRRGAEMSPPAPHEAGAVANGPGTGHVIGPGAEGGGPCWSAHRFSHRAGASRARHCRRPAAWHQQISIHVDGLDGKAAGQTYPKMKPWPGWRARLASPLPLVLPARGFAPCAIPPTAGRMVETAGRFAGGGRQ
jgi:hypothetical protein